MTMFSQHLSMLERKYLVNISGLRRKRRQNYTMSLNPSPNFDLDLRAAKAKQKASTTNAGILSWGKK